MFRKIRSYVPIVIAGILLLAVLGKIWNLEDFAVATATMSVVPSEIRRYLPIIIPLVELTCATLLLIPATRRISMYITSLLFVGFTIFLFTKLVHPSTLGCACFGNVLPVHLTQAAEDRIGFLRNLFIMTLFWWWLSNDKVVPTTRSSHAKPMEKNPGVHAC